MYLKNEDKSNYENHSLYGDIKDKYIVYQFDCIGFTPLHHAVKKG